MNIISEILSKVTIYRLTFFYLLGLTVLAAMLSFFGLMSFGFLPFVLSAGFLTAVSWATNYIFAAVFGARTQPDAAIISGLILALLLYPAGSLHDLGFLFWVAVLSMASKYILAVNKKHVFNPVAIGLVITSFALGSSARWWVGTGYMLPGVILGGLLILIKYRRYNMFAGFLLTALVTILGMGFLGGNDLPSLLIRTFRDTALLFAGFVMLSEPVTTPATARERLYYGCLMGFLLAPQLHVGTFFLTPEMSISLSNIFSFILRRKLKPAVPVSVTVNTPVAGQIP